MRILSVAIVVIAVALTWILIWGTVRILRPKPVEVVNQIPGPVEPVPKIEQHVAKVLCPECLTRDSLERDYGIRLVCKEEAQRYGTGRQVNPSSSTAWVPCSKVVKIIVNKDIEVERR